MAVTYKDAINFLNGEIEHCEAVVCMESDVAIIDEYARSIEVAERILEVLKCCEDEFDPELHKFSMIAIRDVRYSREFVVEARDKYEAKEKLEQCFNDGCFYLDSSECECDESEFSVVDINVFDGEPYGCEVSDEGVWEN